MTDSFPEYCVYASTVRMPDYQQGTPPYSETGGGWSYDSAGHLVLDHEEEANVVVTVPRRAMPTAGFPTGVFVRTGGGGDRPLVDRGVQAVNHGPPIEPGTGPALYFARAGFAGAQVDGPHGGLRNITHGDEQVLMFNITNPIAMRDNIRESALELILFAHMLARFDVDASTCAGVTTPSGTGHIIFDTGTLALMGHSMGATIAPLVLAHEERFRAGVLSGAGGSWIENVMFKLSPFEVRPFAELIVRYNGSGRHLTEFDPVLSLLQWAAEPADPPVYDRYIIHEPLAGAPRSVLMFQGIVDTYIMPTIADATSLSLGIDLADPERDISTDPRISMFPPVGTLLDLVGRRVVTLPQQGNLAVTGTAGATGVVVQLPQDMVEDGHEVAFQTEPPKHMYQCFLTSYAQGAARVPASGGVSDPCQ
jgi:hypothetical protein